MMAAPTSFADMPAELLEEIFNHINIEDKKRARLVNRMWRNAIDTHSTIKFRIVLSDKNITWVQNINPELESIQSLCVERFTNREFDFSKLPNFRHLIFGPKVPIDIFWNVLQRFQVEILEFKDKSIPHSVPVASLHPRVDFTNVKSLSIILTDRDSEEGLDASNVIKTYTEKELDYARFTGFINFIEGLNLPSLETFSIELHFAFFLHDLGFGKLYDFINRNNSITSVTAYIRVFQPEISLPDLKQLDELLVYVDLDFTRCVRPFFSLTNTLKRLHIADTRLNQRIKEECVHYRDPTFNLTNLIAQNCRTLESLTLKLFSINCVDLHLENFQCLKSIELHTQFLRPLSVDLQLPTVKSLTIRSKFSSGVPFIEWEKIVHWITATKEGLEELTFDHIEEFDVQQLRWLLGTTAKVNKILLMNADSELINPLAAHCIATSGVEGMWVYKEIPSVTGPSDRYAVSTFSLDNFMILIDRYFYWDPLE